MGRSIFEDRRLIRKLNRGNIAVVRRIYEKYKDDLVTLAAALLHNVNTAEDVVHEVFVCFIESAGGFKLTGSLKGYLATCVANRARNRNKAMHRRQNISLDQAPPVGSEADSPDYCAIFGEELQRLTWALAQLAYEQREVLLLHLHSGMKFREIAESQGISINTVQGRYRYGLDKLRSLLNSEGKK
ncbi:MAG: RNA polymerase sigma factor [Planctomycetota bacterium]|jgi:RNA polymerase sigma-70 factor (ECF subfamily)